MHSSCWFNPNWSLATIYLAHSRSPFIFSLPCDHLHPSCSHQTFGYFDSSICELRVVFECGPFIITSTWFLRVAAVQGEQRTHNLGSDFNFSITIDLTYTVYALICFDADIFCSINNFNLWYVEISKHHSPSQLGGNILGIIWSWDWSSCTHTINLQMAIRNLGQHQNIQQEVSQCLSLPPSPVPSFYVCKTYIWSQMLRLVKLMVITKLILLFNYTT